MKLELNVVRMANEDVIATSTSCENVYGVAYMWYQPSSLPYKYTVYPNGSSMSGGNSSATKPEGFDGEGWYHIDAQWNIIEKCPDFQDTEAVIADHEITIGN